MNLTCTVAKAQIGNAKFSYTHELRHRQHLSFVQATTMADRISGQRYVDDPSNPNHNDIDDSGRHERDSTARQSQSERQDQSPAHDEQAGETQEEALDMDRAAPDVDSTESVIGSAPRGVPAHRYARRVPRRGGLTVSSVTARSLGTAFSGLQLPTASRGARLLAARQDTTEPLSSTDTSEPSHRAPAGAERGPDSRPGSDRDEQDEDHSTSVDAADATDDEYETQSSDSEDEIGPDHPDFCGICKDRLVDPVKMPCCGKEFCFEDISEWMNQAQTCPHCRTHACGLAPSSQTTRNGFDDLDPTEFLLQSPDFIRNLEESVRLGEISLQDMTARVNESTRRMRNGLLIDMGQRIGRIAYDVNLNSPHHVIGQHLIELRELARQMYEELELRQQGPDDFPHTTNLAREILESSRVIHNTALAFLPSYLRNELAAMGTSDFSADSDAETRPNPPDAADDGHGSEADSLDGVVPLTGDDDTDSALPNPAASQPVIANPAPRRFLDSQTLSRIYRSLDHSRWQRR